MRSLWALGIILTIGCQPKIKPATPKTTQQESEAPSPVKKTQAPTKILRVHLESEPTHLNYLLRQDAWTSRIAIHTVMEPLLRELGDGSLSPVLATSWVESPDKKKLTFTLREKVSWHDKKPFTSSDVAFTFEKIFDDTANTGLMRSAFEPFVERWETPDEKTFILHIKQSSPFLLPSLATLPIYPRHIFENGDFNEHPANRAPIGTGPFVFQEWQRGDFISLAYHDSYWGTPAKLGGITFVKVLDPAAAYAMLKAGEIDFIARLRQEQIKEFLADPEAAERFSHDSFFPSQYSFFLMNQEHPALKEKEVRRALSLLIDRETIRSQVDNDRARTIESPYDPESKSYNTKISPLVFDPEEAAKILDAAGWKDKDKDGIREKGQQKLSIEFFLTAGSTKLEKIIYLIQADLRNAGIELTVNKMEWSIFLDRVQRRDFSLVCFIQIASSLQQDLFELFHSSQTILGGSNYGGFRNPGADKLLEEIRTERDDTKRAALEWRLQEILREELPMIFLFGDQMDFLYSKKFTVSRPEGAHWFWLNGIE